MFEKLKEAMNRRTELEELKTRLVRAEAAAECATAMLQHLHYAGGCVETSWDSEPTPGFVTMQDMVDEVLEAYGTEEMWCRAWPWLSEAKQRSGTAFEVEMPTHPDVPTHPLKITEECGRPILSSSWDPCNEGWDLVLLPKGPFVDGCVLNSYCDGSGSLRGPNGTCMGNWDLQTLEVELHFPDGESNYLNDPYGPLGANLERMIDMLEHSARNVWPDFVKSAAA